VAPILCQLLNAVEIAAKVVDQPPMDANGILFLKGINLLSDGDAVCQAIALNRSAFETARRSAPAMRQKGGVFITVQDTNGDFNFSGRAANRSWSGGIAALAKAVAKEWPKTHVKAIDIQCKNRSSEDIARAIFNELLTGGPGLEIGLTANGERFTVEMQQPEWVQESLALPDGTVVLVSGGAREESREDASCWIEHPEDRQKENGPPPCRRRGQGGQAPYPVEEVEVHGRPSPQDDGKKEGEAQGAVHGRGA